MYNKKRLEQRKKKWDKVFCYYIDRRKGLIFKKY